LIEGLFRALALDLFINWLVIHAALVMVVYVLLAHLFEPRIIAMYLALSCASQPLALMFLLRLCAYPSKWRMLLGTAYVFFATGAMVLGFTGIIHRSWVDGVFVIATMAMVILSVAMFYSVRRYWLKREFG